MNNENKLFAIGIIVCLVFAALTACTSEADIDIAEYCEMRDLWKQDADNGVIEINRKGWPPFGDDGQCAQGVDSES